MLKNIRIFLSKTIAVLKISKKYFATFDFFVKMKLVSTVHKSRSLSKSGYPQVLIGKEAKPSLTKDFGVTTCPPKVLELPTAQ